MSEPPETTSWKNWVAAHSMLNSTPETFQKEVKKTMPVKGYDSVNLPSGLYCKVKTLVKARADLGYRSVTEFVAEAVRKRAEEISKNSNSTPKTD